MAAWEEWNAALASAPQGVDAAELHGALTGLVSAGWQGTSDALPAALALDDPGVDAGARLRGLLGAAAEAMRADLARGATVEPLLPLGKLALRANALVDWCRGFLAGAGLAGALAPTGHAPEVDAVIADFGQIAARRLACSDDDDASFQTVLGFIRAGVVRFHAALASGGRR